MMRPPRPCSPKDSSRGLVEEERRLEVDVVLEVPIGLGDVVHARAAHEDGRRADEDVETAKRADDGFDQFRRDQRPGADRRPRTDAGRRPSPRRLPCTLSSDRSTTATREPAAPKASATSRPMPPGAAGDQNALAFEA